MDEITPSPTARKASMSGAKADRRRSPSFFFGKDCKQTSAPDRALRREWELETELHQVKLQNATFQEQIRILTVERDAAEAELHETKRLSTCLQNEFDTSAEMLKSTKSAVNHLRRRKVEAEVDAEQKDREIGYLLAERDTMAAELAKVTDEKDTLELEVQDLRTANRDSESWIDEITVCVQEAITDHANLESKLQVSGDIIHELQKVIKNDTKNSEMNKKALLRTNADLKEQVNTLKATLEAEQKKNSGTGKNIDWKKKYLLVQQQKSLEVEQMQARLREKTSENASLKLQSSAHLRALEALEAEKAASAAFSPIHDSICEDSHESSAEENTISCNTTVAENEPANDSQEEQPTSLTEDHTTIPLMHKRQGEHTDSPVQVLVILLCLLAALFSRLI